MLLASGEVSVRPLRLRDGPAWVEVRLRNENWLAPWEASPPGLPASQAAWAARHTFATYTTMLRALRRQARQGVTLPFAVCVGGRLAGQITVGNIVRGALNGGYVGYWIDERYAGRGVIPTALALVTDHCFASAGLHRIEANIRPENTASRRVVAKLGFREEGLHRAYLAIDGAYRDHVCYAVLAEDVPAGLFAKLRDTPSQDR